MQLNIGADQANRWRKNLKRAGKQRRIWFSRSAMMWAMILAVAVTASILIVLKGP